MGKRYYCDYCDRSFADGAENRKKHLISVNHQKLRRAHYDIFKDAAAILKDEGTKNPCRKFLQAGHCEYGIGCKYSHYSTADIQALQEQVKLEQNGLGKRRVLPDPDVKGWLDSVLKKKDKSSRNILPTESSGLFLPKVLKSIPSLPPSLIPSKPFDSVKIPSFTQFDFK